MPVDKYDPQFGNKPGGAAKALAAMQKTYGDKKKAESVFYATKNRNKKAAPAKLSL